MAEALTTLAVALMIVAACSCFAVIVWVNAHYENKEQQRYHEKKMKELDND